MVVTGCGSASDGEVPGALDPVGPTPGGIPHVIVGGVPVVRTGELDETARPGVGIRRPPR